VHLTGLFNIFLFVLCRFKIVHAVATSNKLWILIIFVQIFFQYFTHCLSKYGQTILIFNQINIYIEFIIWLNLRTIYLVRWLNRNQQLPLEREVCSWISRKSNRKQICQWLTVPFFLDFFKRTWDAFYIIWGGLLWDGPFSP